MASIFSQIINGEIPCHKIAESDCCLAFLDAFPLVEGHVLVVPKQEVDQLFDLDNKTYNDLMTFAKSIAPAIKKAIPCKRVGVTVIGLEVPHAHVHLLPINKMDDMNFTKPKLNVNSEELANIALKIKEYL